LNATAQPFEIQGLEEVSMSEEITVHEVEAQTIAAVRARMRIAEVPQRFGPLLDKVWSVIRAGDAQKHRHNVFVYRVRDDSDEADVEIGVQVAPCFSGAHEVIGTNTPAGRVAHAVHYGEYHELPGVHQAIIGWCSEQGLERAGVNWEVYDDWEEDAAKRRTDVFHLLTPESTRRADQTSSWSCRLSSDHEVERPFVAKEDPRRVPGETFFE